MRPALYPFAAVVGQEEMKLALLLAAVDWRLGVLLRGDKGSGKTTTARGLAALMPAPAPFVNLPVGATEDRLLGGLHLERTLKGDPVLKPGLLAEAHGGVLYVDEVNLLPAHLGDALLDAAASGIHVVEREGLSALHPSEFVLLGSMNPEEGTLRPQLLDRFALAVTVAAPLDPMLRQAVVERRVAFERDPPLFAATWFVAQEALRAQIADARTRLPTIACPPETLSHIIAIVCSHGIRSLRADLAVMRAATAYAALLADDTMELTHVEAVLPLALAHRTRDRDPGRTPSPPPPAPPSSKPDEEPRSPSKNEATAERIFAPRAVVAPTLHPQDIPGRSTGSGSTLEHPRGPVTGSRPATQPAEFDLRATLNQTLRETGSLQPRASDLHERVRANGSGTRYLFVIDSSGSHAIRERMRLVKGAAESLLARSFQRGDEVALIVFRGVSAEVLLEPTSTLADAIAALEYLPTGGRTPLAHALDLARSYLTPKTMLILMTDGRANYSLHGSDPWQEALGIAAEIDSKALVVDTELSTHPLRQAALLADALRARCLGLDELIAAGESNLSPL